MQKIVRIPRQYDGVQPTARLVSSALPLVLKNIGVLHDARPDLVLAAWPQIIGRHLAPMAHAVAFQEGFLMVKVKNSTLLSVLAQQERARLLKSLRDKFPCITIKNLVFRIG